MLRKAAEPDKKPQVIKVSQRAVTPFINQSGLEDIRGGSNIHITAFRIRRVCCCIITGVSIITHLRFQMIHTPQAPEIQLLPTCT